MSPLPLFYHSQPAVDGTVIAPEETTARHIVQVLRMQPGEQLQLTDGNGWRATGSIASTSKKSCSISVLDSSLQLRPRPALHLAIAFTKSAARNEWLLEKATELGVTQITPLQTARAEKIHARSDRWQGILIAAMLQSQQCFLPALALPVQLHKVLAEAADSRILMAHCMAGDKQILPHALKPDENALFLIGPEGDFTQEEVTLAVSTGATAVSLGVTRLRTETAAMAVCSYFHLINDIVS